MASSCKYVSLLDLLDEADDSPEDNEILNRLKLVAQEHMPQGWSEWQVLNLTKEDIFGNSVDSEVLDTLRFCLPPDDVMKAFRPDATDLSEEGHNDIKLKMTKWAFTRALITKPFHIANKIRGSAEATESFNKATSSIWHDVKEDTEKNLESESSDSSSECGRKRPGTSGSNRPPKKSRGEKHVEDILCFLEGTKAILNSMPRPRPESSSSEDDNISDEEDITINRSGQNQYTASTSTQSGTHPEAASASTSQRNINIPIFSFTPEVRLAPPRIPEPTAQMSSQGIFCQRFGSDGWSRIRYKEVEKRLRASPVFTALKVNAELRGLGFQPSSLLAKQDGVLGTITHGLLCQRKAASDALKAVVNGHPGIHGVIKKLLTDSEFQKSSDDLLQYVCGQRAYVIEERRKEFKARNRVLAERLAEIPPTSTHLFDEQRLSEFIENVGGVSRVFRIQRDSPNRTFCKSNRGSGGQFRRKPRRR